MPRAAKGSDFEREMCKRLSIWWTQGLGMEGRDDVFWRSSQSGGRATQRSKKGWSTFGSYGDIAAVDPIGMPLIQMFTIELKRGSSYGSPFDLFDTRNTRAVRPFEACYNQAVRSHQEAGSHCWLLIGRQDRKDAVVYFDFNPFSICKDGADIREIDRVRFCMNMNDPDGFARRVSFRAMRIGDFLDLLDPKKISLVA